MDPEGFKSTMHSLAMGEAMRAAAEDYKKEVIENEKGSVERYDPLDVDDYLDDPELERLHAERLSELKEEAEKRAKQKTLAEMGHGSYQEIEEGQFLEVVTKTKRVVCHFFHKNFERCKIVDKHLEILCRKYIETRFIKISATGTDYCEAEIGSLEVLIGTYAVQEAPFFTDKLQIQVLPCVVFFVHGKTTDRLVGFEELGGKDSFSANLLEKRMLKAEVLVEPSKQVADDAQVTKIRKGFRETLESDDESSDFGSS